MCSASAIFAFVIFAKIMTCALFLSKLVVDQNSRFNHQICKSIFRRIFRLIKTRWICQNDRKLIFKKTHIFALFNIDHFDRYILSISCEHVFEQLSWFYGWNIRNDGTKVYILLKRRIRIYFFWFLFVFFFSVRLAPTVDVLNTGRVWRLPDR